MEQELAWPILYAPTFRMLFTDPESGQQLSGIFIGSGLLNSHYLATVLVEGPNGKGLALIDLASPRQATRPSTMHSASSGTHDPSLQLEAVPPQAASENLASSTSSSTESQLSSADDSLV